MRIKNILMSWDFLLATMVVIITFYILPSKISNDFCKSVYSIGISVLSIIFSIFFASLAIIMASSDNEFIAFLEEKGDFTALLDSFKITLVMLFVSLIYSIVAFSATDFTHLNSIDKNTYQPSVYFLIFEFIFIYSLLATGLSVKDTILFSLKRAKFIIIKKDR